MEEPTTPPPETPSPDTPPSEAPAPEADPRRIRIVNERMDVTDWKDGEWEHIVSIPMPDNSTWEMYRRTNGEPEWIRFRAGGHLAVATQLCHVWTMLGISGIEPPQVLLEDTARHHSNLAKALAERAKVRAAPPPAATAPAPPKPTKKAAPAKNKVAAKPVKKSRR